MKTNLPFIAAGLASALAGRAFALEAPADDAPPPPVVKQAAAALPEIRLPADEQPAAEAKTETAFLGVISGEVPEVLAAHLDLKAGQGIVVRSVVPGGPAAKAGVAVNDIITGVGEKIIGSPAALSEEIAGHKTGDVVSLDLIHKGKPGKINVTLGSRPRDFGGVDAQAGDLNLEGLPKELADRIRDSIAGNVGGLDLQPGGGTADLEERFRELQKRMLGGFKLPEDNARGEIQMQGSATIRMKDSGGSVEVKSTNGAKEVTVRDAQDNIVWSGPWNSEADKLAAPENVRRRVDSLNLDTDFKGGGLRLNLNNGGLQFKGTTEEEEH